MAGIDLALLMGAFLTGAASAVLSYVNRRQLNDMHAIMNSRLDQLLVITGTAAEARGLKQGRDEHNK